MSNTTEFDQAVASLADLLSRWRVARSEAGLPFTDSEAVRFLNSAGWNLPA